MKCADGDKNDNDNNNCSSWVILSSVFTQQFNT